MIIYSNSCSFGEPQEHPVYGDYFANHCNAKLINCGLASSCNRRIIRRSLRDLNEIAKTETDIVLLLGLTFISRTELWQTDLPATKNDGHFHPLMIDYKKIDWSIKGLINTVVPDIHLYAKESVRNYYKEWLLQFHPEPAVTDLITDLLMLTGWCKSHNIRYLIFSNVDLLPDHTTVDCKSPFLSSLVETFKDDPGVIDPWAFSFGTYARDLGYQPKDSHLYGIHGHPSHDAHQKFSEFLIAKYNQTYPSND